MSSAEWDPGPSIFIPKSPESVKCELITEAESTKSLYFIKLLALAFPEPKPRADPTRDSMTEKAT